MAPKMAAFTIGITPNAASNITAGITKIENHQ